jgi:DNA modification methylase
VVFLRWRNGAPDVDELSPTPTETDVLRMIADGDTVAQILAKTGWSNGRLHRFKIKHRARKYEERIQMRATEEAALQRAFLDDSLNSTVEGDALDVIESLPTQSIQLIVTSPPYNVGRKYGGFDCDRKAHQKYRGWFIQIIAEFARVLREGGTCVLQVGTTKDDAGNVWPLDVLFFEELIRAGLTHQNRISWPTAHGLTPKRKLAERNEVALVFSKGEPIFNRNAARIPQKYPDKRAFRGPNKGRLSGCPLGASPTDFWGDIPHVAHNRGMVDHPAQFPVAFAKRAVLLYTNPSPDHIVFDPFCGSGSTAIACHEAHRPFIGSDLFYSALRAERLANAKPDTVTELSGVTAASMAVWAAEARRVDVSAKPISEEEDAAQLAMVLETNDVAA